MHLAALSINYYCAQQLTLNLTQLPQFQGLKNFYKGWELDGGHIST